MPEWIEPHRMEPREFRCAYCGNKVASETGYAERYRGGVYICPLCREATYFDRADRQTPGVPYGNPVGNVPADIQALYDEARRTTAVQAFTSSVMASRKILMYVAVDRGAKPNQSFADYVNHLDARGYIPPDGKQWVDHIREKGNEANHEIKPSSQGDAQELIDFIEMLLKFVYEFPARLAPKER